MPMEPQLQMEKDVRENRAGTVPRGCTLGALQAGEDAGTGTGVCVGGQPHTASPRWNRPPAMRLAWRGAASAWVCAGLGGFQLHTIRFSNPSAAWTLTFRGLLWFCWVS